MFQFSSSGSPRRLGDLRHSAYFLGVLEACDSLYKSGGNGVLQALAYLDREHENVVLGQSRAAAYAAIDPRALSLCSRYPDVAAMLLPLRFSAQDRVRWRTTGLKAAQELRDPWLESSHLIGLANALDDLGATERALKSYLLALGLKRELGDEAGEARVRANIAIALTRAGKPQAALGYLSPREALPPGTLVVGDAVAGGYNEGAGAAGAVHMALGNTDLALAHLDAALVEARVRADLRKEASVLVDIARVHLVANAIDSAREALDRAIELARSLSDRVLQGQALLQRGLADLRAGNYAAGKEFMEEALPLLAETGASPGEFVALSGLAVTAQMAGNLKRAAELYDAALASVGARDDHGAEVDVLEDFFPQASGRDCPTPSVDEQVPENSGGDTGQGTISALFRAYLNAGDPQRAFQIAEQQLAKAREHGDRSAEAGALGNVGLVYKAVGQTQHAISFYRRSLELYRALADRLGEGRTLGDLGVALRHAGQLDEAIHCFDAQIAFARELDDGVSEANASVNLANCFTMLGRYAHAEEHYDRAAATFRARGDRINEARVLQNLGSIRLLQGDPGAAAELHRQALALFRNTATLSGVGQALANLAFDHYAMGEFAAAIAHAEEALPLLDQSRDPEAARMRSVLEIWRSPGEEESRVP